RTHVGMVPDNTWFGDVRHGGTAICPRWRAVGCFRLGERRGTPNRRTPEPAVVHRFARRLLVFELTNQLALGVIEATGDVRVLGNGYQLRKARQRGTQRDALLPAAAVLQGDF